MCLHIQNSYVYYCLVSPSWLHTTTYSHPHCLLICHRLLLESQLILCTWQRVLSLLHPRGQGDWYHIQKLWLFSALLNDLGLTLVNPGWGANQFNKQNMQQITEYAKNALFPWPSALLQHRNIGTLTVLYACVCLCMDTEQQQKFAEPDVIHPELVYILCINLYCMQKMFNNAYST